MKLHNKLLINASLAIVFQQSSVVWGMGMTDDPLLSKTMGEIELLKEGEADVAEWEIDTWIGRDFQKLWIKTEGEYASEDGESEIESAQIELLYGRTVSAYWDQQFGIRTDIEPDNGRHWLAFGYRGLAPGFWEIDANVYLGEESSSQLNVEIEKELMLTQRWVITPEFEFTINGNTNHDFEEGSGLDNVILGARIGYETKNRKLQPFIGVEGKQFFGTTKNIRKTLGKDTNNFSVIAGIHFWF